MFGWFRKKKRQQPRDRLAELLDLPDGKFTEAISGMIAQAEPAECAMIVVAYHNLVPMVSAISTAMARDRKQFHEDTFLRQLLKKDMGDAICSRRLWWFSSGYLVRRLDRLAASFPALAPSAAQVWASLVEGAQYVPALLKNNVIWSPQEKEYVLMSMSMAGTSDPSPREAMLFALKFMMPKAYQGAPQIASVMEKHGLTFFGP